MYWIAYYLQKGHSLEYLLNLSYIEKKFFIRSMEVYREEMVLYDVEKIKSIYGNGEKVE